MTTSHVCGKCGVPLGSDSLAGLCPECMLLSALGPDPDTPTPATEESPEATPLAAAPVLSRFGDYELLEELAHGGMGVVYKARQVHLDRIVAIKMLLLGQRASDEVVERFKREAQAAAHLRHPNIVAIHEVGEVGGQPFFSMDYVQGKDLAKIVRERPLPARQAATYVRAVAEAIHYAHQQGIIHRDLKPSNILVDFADDQVRVTDFGLAKRLDDHSDLTLSGQVMGSPNHMAPELAAGHHRLASPASDVFSLGAVLYELLTGRPPFLADSLQATLLRIRDTEPVSPRELNARIPRDLETICLKCLEKEPGARFASAQELAEELGRYLQGEPIRTRPTGVVEKTWRWCRRKPALAGLAAAVVALAVVSTVAAIGLAVARQRQEREQYYAEIALAKHHIEEGNIDRALELLLHCPPRYRHWEWGHLLYLCHQDILTIHAHTNVLSELEMRSLSVEAAVAMLRFSPDARSLVTLATDGTAKVWDVTDGRMRFACGGKSNRVTWLAVSPDSHRLAVVQEGQVNVRDAHTGAVLLEFRELAGTATRLAWHPDNQQLAVGTEDGTVEVRNATNGVRLVSLASGPGALDRLSYSPNGRRLVAQSALRCVVWESESYRESNTFELTREQAIHLAADPDARRFVSQDRDSQFTLWENGQAVRVLDRTGETRPWNPPAIFSRDGRRIITRGNQGLAKVWDAATGLPLFIPPDRISVAAFSPDGRRLVTAGRTSIAHVWDVETRREVRALRGHEELVALVEFSPDGRLVATGDRDGVVKLWSATDGREFSVQPNIPWATTLSRDGQRFTIGPANEEVTVCETRSGRGFFRLRVATDYMNTVAFNPDGTRLATSSRFGEPRVWDVDAGTLLFTLKGHTRAAQFALSYSPDGRFIATGSCDSTVRLWDAGTGRPLHVLRGHPSWVDWVSFSSDSRLLVSCGNFQPEVRVWDSNSGRCLRALQAHESGCTFTCFSPDGTQVVTTGFDKTIRFWNTRSGELERELHLRGCTYLMRFSPDGKRLFFWTSRLAVMGNDIAAFEIWDVEAGRQILTLTGYRDLGIQLSISDDGRQILSGALDNTVRQWQVFPWLESDYPGLPHSSLATRVQDYAHRYWRERLAAETEALETPSPMRVIEIPFDRSLIPPRDSKASPRLLDLTRHYTSPLNRPFCPDFSGKCDNDLRMFPAGIAPYAGIDFDARGVVQLRRTHEPESTFDLAWKKYPSRVEDIAVQQRFRRFHLLHGAVDKELDGTPVATLIWHFADGQQAETAIIYGQHARTWWRDEDPSEVTPAGTVAWRGTNPFAIDLAAFRGYQPGQELRLYVSSWDNPRPDVEVTSLDVVSREADSAPFILAITVE